MALGRCAGCGYSDSIKKTHHHVLDCPAYLQLFREHPQRCLDPAAEQQRYQREDNTFEARAERRDQRLQLRFAELDARATVQAQRWRRPKDILDD